jgi:hypothetical protein
LLSDISHSCIVSAAQLLGNLEIMNNKNVTGKSATATRGVARRALARLLTGAALLGIAASANADQLLVTGANWSGDSVYDLVISPSSTTPIAPVIANATTLINNAKDGATHGAFDALVWVSDPVCKTLDLIAADATKGQIVRYQGASTLPNCYDPANGTPSVNPTSQIIFKWSKPGSGPARPNGLSADANGNVFVVSSSGPFDPKPSVWVLPLNSSVNQYCSSAAGVYCAPVLIDNKFSNILTLALAETLVANASAVTSTGTVLWNAGDLLVLVGDSFDARLIVYSSGKLYASPGVLVTHGLPLTGPTSTAIPWAKFLSQLAAPFGMDLWPANTSLGADGGVLFTTIDGRILRFDTVQNKFVSDFADRLGAGLQKLKVGSYANLPYAFVAQLAANGTGQILAFAAPTASGANKPLAAVSHGVMNPVGLAVSSSGVQSVPTVTAGTPCAPPNPACTFAPLGPELVTVVQGYPGDNLSGPVQEQTCSVQTDPRVTIGEEDSWSCSQAALPIGAGTIYCPAFPSAVIPGSVCGHSGPSGAGFAVIEGTATGIDPNDNNSFVTTIGNIDSVMPGTSNLECANFANTGVIPLMAWGSRSDLTTVEGTIPEDSMFGPAFGGQAGFLAELTSTCDTSTSSSRGISIFAIGLGLSNTSQAYVYTLQSEKYEALQQTVSNATITAFVQSTLASDITTAENYVTTAQGGGNFQSNINCALNEIATADGVVRNNLDAFRSNLVTGMPGGGNPNPAGDIDGRLANWYLTLNTELAGNAPNATWPPTNVPACTPVSNNPVIQNFTLQTLSGYPADIFVPVEPLNATQCNLLTLYGDDSPPQWYTLTEFPDYFGMSYPANINSSPNPTAGPPGYGTDIYVMTCYGAAGTTPATAYILNASGATPVVPQGDAPLSVQFAQDMYGDLSWTTSPAGNNASCTLIDEYGGPLPSTITLPQYYPTIASPITGLPGIETSYVPTENTCAISGATPQLIPDMLTLTCSDATYGTAVATLAWTGAGCPD